jgi:hypothetical protein
MLVSALFLFVIVAGVLILAVDVRRDARRWSRGDESRARGCARERRRH